MTVGDLKRWLDASGVSDGTEVRVHGVTGEAHYEVSLMPVNDAGEMIPRAQLMSGDLFRLALMFHPRGAWLTLGEPTKAKE